MEKETQEHIKTLSVYEYKLLNTICDYSDITLADFIGQCTKRKFTDARKIASSFLHKQGYKLHKIGKVISIIPKDHTTIMYQLRKTEDHYKTEPKFKNIVDSVAVIMKKYTENFSTLKFK
jgi:chromosomal replication initiation ATPase DnaA